MGFRVGRILFKVGVPILSGLWVLRVGGNVGELQPWHYIYVYSIESGPMMRVRYMETLAGWAVKGQDSCLQGSGLRVQGSGFRIQGLGFRVWG